MAENPKFKVFLVEDNPVYLKTLQFFLSSNLGEDVKVEAFTNGEDCIERINENPKVIILDYFLNEEKKDAMNGLEVLKAIHKSGVKTTIAMLSSQERYGVAAQTIASGALNYIIKDDDAPQNVLKFIQQQLD